MPIISRLDSTHSHPFASWLITNPTATSLVLDHIKAILPKPDRLFLSLLGSRSVQDGPRWPSLHRVSRPVCPGGLILTVFSPVQDDSMLASFIYDTSSLQDRLIQGALMASTATGVQKVSRAKSREKTEKKTSEMARL